MNLAQPNVKGGLGQARKRPRVVSPRMRLQVVQCSMPQQQAGICAEFSVCSRQHLARESFGPVQFPELLNLRLSLIGWPCILHDQSFARQKTGNSARPTTCATRIPNAPDFVRLRIGDCAVGYIEPETQKLMIGDFFKLDCAPVKGQFCYFAQLAKTRHSVQTTVQRANTSLFLLQRAKRSGCRMHLGATVGGSPSLS